MRTDETSADRGSTLFYIFFRRIRTTMLAIFILALASGSGGTSSGPQLPYGDARIPALRDILPVNVRGDPEVSDYYYGSYYNDAGEEVYVYPSPPPPFPPVPPPQPAHPDALWEVTSGPRYCELTHNETCVTTGEGYTGTYEQCTVKTLQPMMVRGWVLLSSEFATLTLGDTNLTVLSASQIDNGQWHSSTPAFSLERRVNWDDPSVADSLANLSHVVTVVAEDQTLTYQTKLLESSTTQSGKVRNNEKGFFLCGTLFSPSLPPSPSPCLLYTSPSPRDPTSSRMPSSA